ncbi:MAG: AMP-binding protein [Myxococcales bacterium]|nr:AMP-binding protein [Myxococcales bacterium]MCB9519397.1 AMP-binding protein [Myxococcales bacterium]MCB9531296.1 AMP-binding protein [Myxococcales bacterium]
MSSRTLIELFEGRVSDFGDAVALRQPAEDGGWRDVSYAEWLRGSTLLAAGLAELGVAAGDRVAIVSSTRAEWVLADQAIFLAGAVSVPLYETSRPRQMRMMLEDAGAVAVLVEDPRQLEKLLRVVDELPALRSVVYFDDLARGGEGGAEVSLRLDELDTSSLGDRLLPLSRLRELGARALGADANIVRTRRLAVTPDSLASIVYTAGTTGRPRGVALTHRAFVAQVEANLLALPLSASDEQVLFLPLAQIFARAIYMTTMAAGCVTTFSRGYAWVPAELAERNPTLLVAVPQVFQRLYDTARKVFVRGSERRERAARRFVEVARRRSAHKTGGAKLTVVDRAELVLADASLLRNLRVAFGTRFRFAVSGGAPMPTELVEVFHGAGVPILEGYGLTEHCAAAAVNRPDALRPGTVGRPLPGVEVRIAADGEVLLRSECVMRGYWNDAEATAAALAGAWLHTGDIGEFDGQTLRITDRKRDIIVTAAGRHIAPKAIEAQLEALPWVAHAVVHGDSRPFLSALITLRREAIVAWAAENGLGGSSFDTLASHPKVFELLDRAIQQVNAELPRAECVRRFAILPDDFSWESGELTATWKMRRQFVTEKYRSVLDGFYAAS